MNPHPKGTRARLLLTSVFGPYAQDDEFGSRAINPMELYHNQVTRAQGAFSLRMFHRSWGIMMIQQNISAPCTVLDFPTRDAFARELASHSYEVVGISSIIVNLGKVREMSRMVRELSPQSVIVVGGHVTAIPGIENMVDADHIVRGEGIRWMRDTWARTRRERLSIRKSCRASRREFSECVCRSSKEERRRRSFRRWDARWAATSARPRHFLAARGSSLTSSKRATHSS